MKYLNKVYKLTASEDFIVYRAVNGIQPEDVTHLTYGKSIDAVFGVGTYFAFSEEDAEDYVDPTKEFSLIIKYKITAARVLNLFSGKNIDGLQKPSEGLDIYDLDLSKKLGDGFDGDQLVERAAKHYDVIALYEHDEIVDGGEQLIVPPKANITITPLSYTKITKGKKKKNLVWPDL